MSAAIACCVFANVLSFVQCISCSQYINSLTPELNPSTQRCLTRFFTGDFASWAVHFVNICVKNQQMQQLFIKFINYICMVAPTCFGITLPSPGSIPRAFWEMLNWGAVDRILWMRVLCLVTWCVAIRDRRNNWCICWFTARRLYKSFGVKGLIR
jgi:hypothetical protein